MQVPQPAFDETMLFYKCVLILKLIMNMVPLTSKFKILQKECYRLLIYAVSCTNCIKIGHGVINLLDWRSGLNDDSIRAISVIWTDTILINQTKMYFNYVLAQYDSNNHQKDECIEVS